MILRCDQEQAQSQTCLHWYDKLSRPTSVHARNLHPPSPPSVSTSFCHHCNLFQPRSVTTVICFNLCLQSVSTSAYFNLNLFRARTIYHTCTHTLSCCLRVEFRLHVSTRPPKKKQQKTKKKQKIQLLQPSGMIESGWCIGLSHFITLFKTKMEGYIRSITAKTKPKLVVVCMIYYLDEIAGGSWADGTLKMLGYNRNPAKLQMLIRKIFTEATCKIEVEGVKVLPFPLFEVLDGKTTDDYCQRVEPSSQGGNKIGKELVDRIILSEQLHAESERYVAAAAAAANGGGADAAAAGGSSSIQEKIP